jgi:hypothetical protein
VLQLSLSSKVQLRLLFCAAVVVAWSAIRLVHEVVLITEASVRAGLF